MSSLLEMAKIIVAERIGKNQKNQKQQEKIVEQPQKIDEILNLSVDVTDQLVELYDQYRHLLPYKKVQMYNNGPGDVFFCINRWYGQPNAAVVHPGQNSEPFELDIKKVYFICNSGENATVNLTIWK